MEALTPPVAAEYNVQITIMPLPQLPTQPVQDLPRPWSCTPGSALCLLAERRGTASLLSALDRETESSGLAVAADNAGRPHRTP